MKHYHYTLISLAVMSACYSSSANADLKTQCLSNIPHFSGETIKGEQTALPVHIESNTAAINQLKNAIYSGNVVLKQGNRSIVTPQMTVEKNEKIGHYAKLKGKFDYSDETIRVTGRNASMNLSSKDAMLSNIHYQLVDRQGRGTAESTSLHNKTRILKNATYTSCLPNDNSWQINASEMIQYIDEEYAEMWHAKLKVLGVPVFYTPYLQFPLGDRRRSGLLTPSYSHSSNNGFTYSQPIYWNIAPNMDATFTPTYYSHRGWQLNSEFRYLTNLGIGTIAAEYMKKDRYQYWDKRDQSRHLLHWRHSMSFLSDWRLSMDYTKVSDRRYFSDFASPYGQSTSGYATQNFKLGYYQPTYNISIAAKKFQTFDKDGTKPYRVFPQIELNYYKNNIWRNSDFRLYSQLAHFDNDSKDMPTVWRFHLEPILNIPLASRYGSLNLETKLYATQYWQKAGKKQTIKEKVSRVLPQIKVNFKTVLEADKQLFSGFNQILEPQIQYLYRPYKNQADIGTAKQLGLGYDSTLRQQDYFSLFSDRRYSGLDRIASANQITLGATTRFMKESTGEEYFNLSLGQIYYLADSRIDNSRENSTKGNTSSWAVETNWKFSPKWNLNGSYQYDTRLKETALANLALQYKPSNDKVIKFNYRYASQHYIDQNLKANTYGQDIKQVGFVAGWDITDNISIATSYYHDIALSKLVETRLGVTYNNCCWKTTAYIARHLISTPYNKPDTKNDLYYDNRFGINVELRFGSNYDSGVSKMLDKGIIPYTEEFDIN
ncbi:LPS assembly protein LptD [Pasteurella skyensis]|uniref:LPS-assembly protein LptD n=1 Tax=Phocoenobacter skyensis TaxID=97481 RepID=A0AAJ6NA24_9PAST|nr:LPS assembly protein LptD [Pasteurella skyensis]MDP8162143.1 LPS assembly protein LptD [Pasteurella skyensis]MDP8173002.1 LPS assembly protein LptD [Pasteurella skyensis]MDP8176769.1 LPS assembly protein LptD [Pasteurella skyensis]MDP8179473.1 LPS assembly protein LptD [Pasteurella skyensis]MDP8183673.1 LPS assembly protein LptD [Pasteurella skyensis]